MRFLLICAGAFALLFASQASAQTCELRRVASYDMLRNSAGHIVITVRVADTDERMVVDTGTWFSFLTPETANRLKLSRTKLPGFVSYTGPRGRRTLETTRVPAVEIGPLRVTGVDFMVVPGSASLGGDADGLIGANILKQFDVDFDFAHKKVNFFSQDHCPGQVVYWSASGATKIPFRFDGATITLPIELDGKEVEAVLDTGAFASTLSMPMAQQMFGLNVDTEGVDAKEYTRADGSTWTDYTHTFATLRFGGMTVPSATVHLLPDVMGRAFVNDNPDVDYGLLQLQLRHALLGLSELSHLHLYISYKEKLLYVTAADQH